MEHEPVVLAGDGLTLRHPVESDASAVADAVRRSLPELVPWMPWAGPGYDVGDATQWLRGEFGDVHRFVIVDGAGTIVGTCGLNRVDDLNRSANLGYWVRSDRVGRGIATTATRLLARFGLDIDGAAYHRLVVSMSIRNHASRRVAEKAGATFEGRCRGEMLLHGEFHDTERWSFVAGDL